MDSNQFDMDKKKAAIIGISAIGSILVSYFVYKKVVDEDGDAKIRKRDKMLRKARQQAKSKQSSKSRIVGASSQFHSPDELTQDERDQQNIERMEQDLRNAATGTKTIYFDNNDNMYTEEEVMSGSIKQKRTLTKMKVRVPENDRKRLVEVQSKQTRQCLNDFLSQIKEKKHHYVEERTGLQPGKARSQRLRLGLGSELTTSSGTVRSLNRIKLEPRHFKSKEGTVWLNMFETISNNYCLGDTSNNNSLKSKMDPHRYVLPRNDKARSSKRQLSRDQASLGDQGRIYTATGERKSRADRYYNQQAQGHNNDNRLQGKPRITRSTSLDMNMNNFE